jgi:hypothetical protein
MEYGASELIPGGFVIDSDRSSIPILLDFFFFRGIPQRRQTEHGHLFSQQGFKVALNLFQIRFRHKPGERSLKC